MIRRPSGCRRVVVAAAVVTALTGCTVATGPDLTTSAPPAGAGVDYQIGGPYPPPAGASVVIRDQAAAPAPGVYNICYVNAFQVQPGAEGEWDPDLLLRDADGEVVYDTEWGEALLDIRTADRRNRIAQRVETWISGCADRGYQGVEPDNYDSYTRSGDLITPDQAQELIRLLSAHAHGEGLAIGQKNTADLAGARRRNGLDFAVAEECGQFDECGDYTAAFGSAVIVVEYTDEGLAGACAGWGDTLSIVRRDVDVLPDGRPGHVRAVC